MRIRAHEETHALEEMGGLEYLTDALRRNQHVNLNLKDVEEIELEQN